jgi:predicted MFS family arabinose efflux permease
LLAVIAVSALFMAANFALFSYLVPAAGAFIDAAPGEISLLFAALGAASIFGNTLTARFMDRVGAGNVVLCCMAAVLAGHLAWPWSAGHPALLMAAVSVWGLGFAAALSAQQARLAALSPAQAPVSIALNSSATYLGQAVGTAAGGSVIGHVSGAAGYASLAGLSVPLILAAAAVSLFVAGPFQRKEPA